WKDQNYIVKDQRSIVRDQRSRSESSSETAATAGCTTKQAAIVSIISSAVIAARVVSTVVSTRVDGIDHYRTHHGLHTISVRRTVSHSISIAISGVTAVSISGVHWLSDDDHSGERKPH
ncbi:hypothetical protein PFISCL1PPCAC_6540, partial [Pristionchus fissidentatus]